MMVPMLADSSEQNLEKRKVGCWGERLAGYLVSLKVEQMAAQRKVVQRDKWWVEMTASMRVDQMVAWMVDSLVDRKVEMSVYLKVGLWAELTVDTKVGQLDA
eukprot:scaffold2342_cov248-Ochromonas_danica.AAC.5